MVARSRRKFGSNIAGLFNESGRGLVRVPLAGSRLDMQDVHNGAGPSAGSRRRRGSNGTDSGHRPAPSTALDSRCRACTLTMHRPPSTTSVSIDDFHASGWKAACSFGSSGYFSRWSGLCTAAEAANGEGAFARAKVLWLLGDACSLRLDPQKLNEPLSATLERAEHSVSLADFDDKAIGLLDVILPELEDPLLQARIADILWLTRQPRRKLSDATSAIDAYRSTPLDADSWFLHDGKNCWRRALMLALQIRAPGASRVAEMRDALFAAIAKQLSEGDAGPSMIETLLEYGLAQAYILDLAERLVERANRTLENDTGNRFFLARHYLALAKRCFGLKQNYERCADVDSAISDAFAAEAQTRLSGTHPSHVVAASFYEDAVQALLPIPKQLRAARGIDDKLRSLRQTQRDVAQRSMGDFVPMRGEPIDLEQEIRTAQEQVSGKELTEALLALTECWPLAKRSELERRARERMENFLSNRLFSSQKLAGDGRVIAKSPAAGDLATASAEEDKALWAKMVQDHHFSIRFAVQSSIAPALRQIVLDHLITEDDLISVVALSGIVPSERVGLIAKGLKAGFEGDFIVALHLLAPQLEHLVRSHLQLKGAKTTIPDAEGLQREAGLSTLAALPEMVEVFGEDLAFEIRAMFCDAFGPNLRNELAHGLLDTEALQSAESIYAWWLVLRTIYGQYWYLQE